MCGESSGSIYRLCRRASSNNQFDCSSCVRAVPLKGLVLLVCVGLVASESVRGRGTDLPVV